MRTSRRQFTWYPFATRPSLSRLWGIRGWQGVVDWGPVEELYIQESEITSVLLWSFDNEGLHDDLH